MKFTTTSIAGDVEILASKDFQAIPIVVAAPGSGTVVKAGTPLTDGGESTTGENAVGILLYDVDTAANPNGAAVVKGIIDSTKAQAHSGVSYNASNLKAALPGVVLRGNIKALGGNAALKSMTLANMTLTPSFAKDVYSYESSTTYSTNTITVETDDASASAVITYGENTIENGNAITWSGTTSVVTVVVTAENDATQNTYSVTVTQS